LEKKKKKFPPLNRVFRNGGEKGGGGLLRSKGGANPGPKKCRKGDSRGKVFLFPENSEKKKKTFGNPAEKM